MAKLKKQYLIKLDRPCTIGEMECLAGIERDEKSRREFWRRYYKPNHDFVADGVKALRSLAAIRIKRGEFSLI